MTLSPRVPAATTDAAAHYERVTAAWSLLMGDDLHYGLFAAADEPLEVATGALTQAMVDAAQLVPGLRVLDVGCGTGNPACRLAELGCSVLGISTSPSGIEAARRRAEDRGLSDRARFEVGDALDLRVADGAVDRVWVMESSHLMEDKERLLAECARALRPGGRLVLCDVIRRRELPLREVLRHAAEFDLLRRVFGRAKMEDLDFYAAATARSGLKLDGCEDLTELTRPTFARWRSNAIGHADQIDALVGQSYRTEFTTACDVLERFWDDGTLGYGLIAAARPAGAVAE